MLRDILSAVINLSSNELLQNFNNKIIKYKNGNENDENDIKDTMFESYSYINCIALENCFEAYHSRAI